MVYKEKYSFSKKIEKSLGILGVILKNKNLYLYEKFKKNKEYLFNRKNYYNKNIEMSSEEKKEYLKNIKYICFYNHFHNGDISHAREYIKYILNNCPNYKYRYYHYNGPRLLADIDNLKYKNLKGTHLPIWKFLTKKKDCLFVNLWVGQDKSYNSYKMEDKYILYFKKLFFLLGIPYPNNYVWCPEIDYSKFITPRITQFIKNKNKLRILIANGNVRSKQSENFSFVPIIKELLARFKDIEIILTKKENLSNNRVIYTQDLTKMKKGDLNEISLISTSADIIIGRDSGPFAYCITKENYKDKKKTYIILVKYSFSSNNYLGGPFFFKNAKSEIIFSNNFNKEDILTLISKTIEKKLQ